METMEVHGNQATFNVESVLKKNIVDSEYYRATCMKMVTWDEIVDEIFNTVDHVEPWMSGNARGASTAFCLMYRLFSLKLLKQQVRDLIDHEDSPYIRAVGFLYLRYVANPKTLWDEWLCGYMRDSEEIQPSGSLGKTVTMAAYIRDVFLEQYYFETIFPRIPKPVHDQFVLNLTGMGQPTKAVGNGGQGGTDRRGVDEPNRRPASVKASLSVAFGQRAPNRATAREEGRGLGAGMKGTLGTGPSNRSPVYGGADEERRGHRGREGSSRQHNDRDYDRRRDGSSRGGDRGYSERGQTGSRDYRGDHRGSSDRHRNDRYDDRYRGHGSERQGAPRDRYQREDRDRDRKRSRSHDPGRSSPAKSRPGHRDASDVFGSSRMPPAKTDNLHDLYR